MPKRILKIATLTLADVKESILYILPYKMKQEKNCFLSSADYPDSEK